MNVIVFGVWDKFHNTFNQDLWKSKVLNKALLEGKTRTPCVRALPLPIPMGISRDYEVKLMSMFYNNNLLNYFLYDTQRNQCSSPMCPFGDGEQIAFHILTDCKMVPSSTRNVIIECMMLHNMIEDEDKLVADEVSILNCSRDPIFIKLCLSIILSNNPPIRSNIVLSY